VLLKEGWSRDYVELTTLQTLYRLNCTQKQTGRQLNLKKTKIICSTKQQDSRILYQLRLQSDLFVLLQYRVHINNQFWKQQRHG